MSLQVDWVLPFPLEDGVLPADTLVVKSRGTSGAGQFEIAGSAPAPDGSLFRARDAIGLRITFALPSPCSPVAIRVSEEYPVQEVGGKVRISVQGESETRPNIGNLFASLFFLPDVSSRGKSLPLNEDNLEEKTFWIDDVSCRIASIESDLIVLEPACFVFATNNKDDPNQPSHMAVFDYRYRLEELLRVAISGSGNANGAVKTTFRYYLDVIRGNLRFEYAMGSFLRSHVMSWLEREDSAYRSSLDPLPFLAHDTLDISKRINIPDDLGTRNLIYFGAPGTGKSYSLNEAAKAFPEGNVRRVTFYPDYTYSQFVGCFKPMTEDIPREDGSVESRITYRYVLGPFLETYVKAVKNPGQNFLLIVEEINRANPATVFGDVFQLLDRKADGSSEYAIAAPEEMRKQLARELGESAEVETIAIPSNMYIWATMNSADQGVFPMDTAFKRRWDFRYMGIDEGEDAEIDSSGKKLNEITVPLDGGRVYWNELRKAINRLMMEHGRISEDKLLGPFFLNPSALTDERFADAFKDKVLLYLFEDAGRTRRVDLFWQPNTTYSQVCAEFDSGGSHVFGSGFDESAIWVNGNEDSSENQE